MIKWLYNNVPFIRRQILKINFLNQSKPVDFEKLTESFIDSNGKRYYKYPDDFDLPILRFNQLQKKIMEIGSCFTGDEITLMINEMSTCFEEAFAKDNPKEKLKHVAKIGHLISEAQLRGKILVREDILFEMVGCLYIREDQNPAKWDQDIELEKVEQFKKDSRSGLYDFFYKAGLNTYIPYLKDMENGLEAYLEKTRVQIQALNMRISGDHKLSKNNVKI